MRQSNLRYPIIILAMLVLWTIGFVDLADHVSEDRAILGRYSLPYFAVLVLYGCGFLLWLGLLLWPKSRVWVERGIDSIQRNVWLALPVFTGIAAAAWLMPRYPLFTGNGRLMSSMLALLILVGLILIFTGWRQESKPRFWQKGAVLLLLILIAIEISMQGLAAFGLLPGKQNIAGLYVPYGRVYYTEEGFGNGLTNNFGWYYPHFKLEPESRRVLIIGDSFIQALQIDPQQHTGVQLEQFINQAKAGAETEVMALGMPGFGPGLYISLTRLDHAIQLFEPDEIIVFFNLGSDFQTATEPAGYNLFFELKEGNAVIHNESFNYQHDLKHLILDGYEPEFNPALTLNSHYLTPKLVSRWLSDEAKAYEMSTVADEFDIPGFTGVVLNRIVLDETHNKITAIDLLSTPGKNNFVFEKEAGQKATDALLVAQSLLELSSDFAKAKGVTFRIVTIPAFPKAFYAQSSGADWETEIGNYDLALPERALQAFAEEQKISFLAMGRYMQETGISVDEIKNLYYSDGLGHFTPEGHRYFAEAVYSCFYHSETQVKEKSCFVD